MKKLLTVLAVVALVAISFTSCNNGTPAPSATIPEAMRGTWADRTGITTLEITADSFISTTEGLKIDYTKDYDITVEGDTVSFASKAIGGPTKIFAYADGVITESQSLAGETPVEVTTYTPVDAAE